MNRSTSLLMVAFVWLAGLACASVTLGDWLTTPEIADLFWPNDVNATVVKLLGGDIEPDALERLQPVLSALSVSLRLAGLTLLAGTVAWMFSPRDQFLNGAVRLGWGLGITWSATGLLWCAAEFVARPFVYHLLAPGMMTLAGITVWYWMTTARRTRNRAADSPPSRGITAWIVLLTFAAGWIAISFCLNERLYANLLIPHGDSTMYEEHLWNVWHGKGFRSYLDQGLFLGEHIQVIHLLLLPFHIVWPSHLMLELAESIALGSCTIPLFLIVQRRTNDHWAAVLVAIAWLFYFPMHYLDIAIDQKTFRPLCLGIPFLFWMIQAAERAHWKRAWICLVVALLAKEDVALITGSVAAVFAVSPRSFDGEPATTRRWGIAACLFSVVWLLAAVLVVIPAFRSGEVVHYSRYFGDLGNSPGELLKTAVTEPLRVLALIFSGRTLQYFVVFAAPLCFLIVRSPLRLATGLLTFVMLSLIQLGTGTDGTGFPPVPYHHFHAPLLVVIFWALASSLQPLFDDEHHSAVRLLPESTRSAALLVLCCSLATGITGSLFPSGTTFWSNETVFGRHRLYFPRPDQPEEQRIIERAAMSDRVAEIIPADARVASTDFIHTRLTHRERSYDYSDYERRVNEPGQRVPADTEYIVIDTGHRYSTIRSAADVPELKEPGTWKLLPDETQGYFLILVRE